MHEVDNHHAAGARLAFNTVDEHWLKCLKRFIDKPDNLIAYFFTFIDQKLAVVIVPIEGQIPDTLTLKVVG